MKSKALVAILATTLGLVMLNAPAAMAVSDWWTHPDGVGKMHFDDGGDIYKVCDTKTDDVGVSGRIEVRQADGSWNSFPWVRDGNGNNGDCDGVNNTDVIREGADYRFRICQQNTAQGTRYNCAVSTPISGS